MDATQSLPDSQQQDARRPCLIYPTEFLFIRLNQGIDSQAAAPLRMPQLALSVDGKGCRLRT
jgi:hypothetical protein